MSASLRFVQVKKVITFHCRSTTNEKSEKTRNKKKLFDSVTSVKIIAFIIVCLIR